MFFNQLKLKRKNSKTIPFEVEFKSKIEELIGKKLENIFYKNLFEKSFALAFSSRLKCLRFILNRWVIEFNAIES